MIISGTGQALMSIMDTAFLGHINQVALGAAALGGLYYFTIAILGFGFGTGMQIIIARHDGEKNFAKIGEVVDQSIFFLVAIALLVFGLSKSISPILLKNIIKSEAIYTATLEFISYRDYGFIFIYIFCIYRALFLGISNTKPVGYAMIVMLICNFILNYLLVFGNFGFPRMEVGGAALASVLSEFIAVIYFIFYVKFYVQVEKYNLFKFKKIDVSIFKKTINISAPIMLQNFVSVTSWFIFFLIVEQIGERELAISNLIRNVYLILMVPLLAFSNSTNTLVSNLIGQGKREDVFELLKKILIMSLVITLLVDVLNLIYPNFTLSIFTNDENLIASSLPSLYVISGAIILFSLAMVLLAGVSGTGATRIALYIELSTLVFYLLSTWLIAIKLKQEIEIVWCVEYVYFLFIGLLSFLYLRSNRWKSIKI
jgi:putative MATE family efflux protein